MFKKWALKIATNYLVTKIDSPEFKKSIINSVNRKINIPNLNEQEEEELFKSILKAMVSFIKNL